jgi:RHS repeat-associated protein
VESSLTFRTANQQAVQNLELRVNDLGNVEWRRLTRHEAPSGAPVHEVKTESFSFDSQNRLTSSYVIGQDAQHFTFAANGNIASKTGTGSYTYGGGAGAGPHAVTGVTLGGSSRRYTYDAKGRMENEYLMPEGGSELLLRQVAYTSFDQPQFIQHWRSAPLSSDLAELGESGVPWDQTCTMQFYFGAGLQRLISVKYKGLLKTQTLSLGGYEIRETTRGSLGTLVEKEERSSFGNGAKVKRWTAVNPVIPIMAYEYGVSDHLGSDSVTYTGEGQEQSQRGHLKEGEVQKTERQSYDAWGARRNADTWAPAKGPLGESNPSEEREGSNLARGYTGHEMLDDVGLIHMNGRLYDPSLGRMCGADPYVQTPENLQNYNRYSYVLNNPLSQIDPSGHFIIGLIVALGAAIIGAIGAVISTVLAFVAYLAALAAQFVVMVAGAVVQAFGAMGGMLMAAAKAGIAKVAAGMTLKKVLIGASLSAVYSGAQTAINGGSFSDVLKAAAMGAVTGAVGAVVGGAMHVFGDALGSMLQGGGNILGTVVHLAAHGAAGGGMSAAMGGSFQDGFIGGIIGAGVTGALGKVFSGVSKDIRCPGTNGGCSSQRWCGFRALWRKIC